MEYLEIACINHEKYIVHGKILIKERYGDFYTNSLEQIEQTLTPEQKKVVDEFLQKQDHELFLLLKETING